MPLRRRIIFLSIIASILALDLWTKEIAFEAVPSPRERITVIDGFFYIDHVRNPGAMWGLGQDVPRGVWIGLRSIVALAIGIYCLRQKSLPWFPFFAFAFVLGGALGNLYDNMFALDGKVRDFVSWVFWGWRFPVFNIADSGISVGATMLFLWYARADWLAMRARRAKERADESL